MALNRFVLIALLSFGLSLFIPIPSIAVHKGAGDLVCGNCHTMHSSQGGTNGMSMGGASGSFILLRSGNSSINSRAEIHKLCLQCHGVGSNATQEDVAHAPQNVVAPKVYSSGTQWDQNDPFNKIGAGGNFYNELDGSWNPSDTASLGKGHSIGTGPGITPPGGDQPIGGEGFSCTNCHDPHGTANPSDANINIFRNLRVSAVGAGSNSGVKFYTGTDRPWNTTMSYVGGVSAVDSVHTAYFGGSELDKASQVIWPVYRGTLQNDPTQDKNNSNSYSTNNDSFPTYPTMSKWCAQCHDSWHDKLPQGSGNKIITDDRFWFRHPVNSMVPRKAVKGCAGSCHVDALDRSNYDSDLITNGKALPVTASNPNFFTPGGYVYYLPVVSPGTCGTSPNLGCMDIQDVGTSAGDNHKVFCLTCHFAHGGPYYDNLRWDYTSAVSSGSQSGNGVPSNVGCQLCHNR